ncbi:hypothetical protein C0J52_00180 [Blattella germanica]|nr:hypothetical protein C0J52_00180 [Blattella germanica]
MCYIFGTILTFNVVCLVDIVCQIAAEPLPRGPMIMFCFVGAGMFLASCVVSFVSYRRVYHRAGFLLACATLQAVLSVIFLADGIITVVLAFLVKLRIIE